LASRERRFAMIPCDIEEWDGWTDLAPLEQWLYDLLRRQRDLTQAGIIDLHISRWAGTSKGATREMVQGLLASLAAKEYIVVDFDREEVLLCWFITTDGVYRKPNPLAAAATAIKHVRSPGIKTVLYNELKMLDESGQVPVAHVPVIRHLIGQLESYALIGARQPLHNPTPAIPLPLSNGRAPVAELVPSGSAAIAQRADDGLATVAESGQTLPESGQDNRCAGVPSLTSVPVVGIGVDEKQETENLSSPATACDPDENLPPGNPDDRPDTRALCEQLLIWLRTNGETKPGLKITKTWLRDMRLLIDVDGRDPADVAKCIEWCQRDAFWRDKVESPKKLREKYNALRQQAKARRDQERAAAQNGGHGRRPDPSANMPHPPPASTIAVPPPGVADDPAAYLEWQRSQRAVPAPAAPPDETEAFA
jgi:hypothetical protein